VAIVARNDEVQADGGLAAVVRELDPLSPSTLSTTAADALRPPLPRRSNSRASALAPCGGI
jgi:hypothetical protein